MGAMVRASTVNVVLRTFFPVAAMLAVATHLIVSMVFGKPRGLVESLVVALGSVMVMAHHLMAVVASVAGSKFDVDDADGAVSLVKE